MAIDKLSSGSFRGAQYWDERFFRGDTPWELHGPSVVLEEALSELFAQHQSLCGASILSPGCGSGSDAIKLAQRGARVIAVDWSASACERVRNRVCAKSVRLGEGSVRVVHANFFELAAEPVDCICEHTFFCAIEPSMRLDYVTAISRWLSSGGYLVGNFFVVSEEDARSLPGLSLARDGSGPPFGVTESELTQLLSEQFKKIQLRPATVGEGSRRPGLEWVGVFQRL